MLPPILTSAIIAPISTCLLEISCSAIGSGMGTAGLVGILEAVNVMGNNYWIPIIVIDLLVTNVDSALEFIKLLEN